MLQDPIDILQQRLDEINQIKCDDIAFKKYRLKYIISIELLKNNAFVEEKDKRKKLSEFDIRIINNECEIGQVDYYANLLQVGRKAILTQLKKNKKIKNL